MNAVSFTRFMAILLVTNSHFDALYPKSLVALATGGAIGNALFFFVSGYALFMSRRTSFFDWIFRRFSRILPSAWIFCFVAGMLGVAEFTPLGSALLSYHWFLRAIIIFYPIFFFAVKFFGKNLWVAAVLALIPYAAMILALPHETFIAETGFLGIRWYYLAIMLLGGVFAQHKEFFAAKNCGFAPAAAAAVAGTAFLAAHYAIQWATPRCAFPEIQLFTPVVLTLSTCGFFLLFQNLCESFAFPPALSVPIVVLSNLTLDIYLVQFEVVKFCAGFAAPFPLGFLAGALLVLLSAAILNRVAEETRTLLPSFRIAFSRT